jgi:hypothetical protein
MGAHDGPEYAPKTIGNGVNSENNTDSDIYEVLPEEPTDKEPLTAGDTKSKTAAKPKREKKAGRVPELLKDFDPNAAEVAMNDFFNHHDTNSQFNKYLAIAAWFKRYQNVDEITPSHIYTCYQLMKWQAPDNLSQPFNDMKRLRSYFERTQGGWAISIVGMNELDRQRKDAN